MTGLPYIVRELIKFRPQGDSPVTSLPYQLCICGSKESSDCVKSDNIAVYKGQTFTVPLLAKAQVGNTSTTVIATTGLQAKLDPSEVSQQLPNHCHNLSYNVCSTNSSREMSLYPDGPCRDIGSSKVTIAITFYLVLMGSLIQVKSALV